ncbi:phospholipid phosphatase 1-like isoform X2 [Rhynchophorus ferrugineus]|uniref:phospholipid phosphatase 1-like isoform X2 n=1 Tax=Rhynchophorus ferrugineus TaxID=354439 RepID=UPI003FCD82FE
MNNVSCNNIGRGFYLSGCTNFFDNKAMVTPLSSSDSQTHPSVAIDITGPEKPTKEKPPRWVRRVQLIDVVNVILILLVVSVIILLELGYIPGKKIGFYCKDPLISQPYHGETINAVTLLVSNLIVIPLLVLLLTDFCFKRHSMPWMWINDAWFIYKDFLTGCGLVLVLTEIMKALVGEHRPHFFDVCRPDTAENCTAGQYIETYECTVTKYSHHFMADTSKSFPSGHSSLSVFVAIFCSYLLQTRLSCIAGQICRMFTICLCITWCMICSLTRITDRRHHWWDVAAGMLLGAMCAIYTAYNNHSKIKQECIPRVAVSTTTLVDIKNKSAKSEII